MQTFHIVQPINHIGMYMASMLTTNTGTAKLAERINVRRQIAISLYLRNDASWSDDSDDEGRKLSWGYASARVSTIARKGTRVGEKERCRWE